MKIGLYDIPEEGIEIHSNETAETLDITPSDLILDEGVHIDAKITRDGEIIFVDGAIKTVLKLTCRRCNGEFLYPVDTIFHCHEEPISHASTEIELVLRKEDMDIDHYSGDGVEINSIFREQLILSSPMYPLCKTDCLGLCPRCGQNLNIKKCECKIEEKESPFSILKEFLK